MWRLVWVCPGDLKTLFSTWTSLVPARNRKSWCFILQSMIWQLWLCRNAFIFCGLQDSALTIFTKVTHQTFSWEWASFDHSHHFTLQAWLHKPWLVAAWSSVFSGVLGGVGLGLWWAGEFWWGRFLGRLFFSLLVGCVGCTSLFLFSLSSPLYWCVGSLFLLVWVFFSFAGLRLSFCLCRKSSRSPVPASPVLASSRFLPSNSHCLNRLSLEGFK